MELQAWLISIHLYSPNALETARVEKLEHCVLPDALAGDSPAIGLRDPDGNLIVFTPPGQQQEPGHQTALPLRAASRGGCKTNATKPAQAGRPRPHECNY